MGNYDYYPYGNGERWTGGKKPKLARRATPARDWKKRQKFASKFAYGDSPYGNGQVEKKITIWVLTCIHKVWIQ